MKTITVDGHLTMNEAVKAVRGGAAVRISAEAEGKINEARAVVEECVAQDRVVYGLTTGFGKFSDVTISEEDCFKLQENLIMSHSCGVGEPLPDEVVRMMMLLRINALTTGNSGIRLSTIKTLAEMLNKDVIPVVPSQGSLGASGDLVPLAHMSLVLIGKGEAIYKGKQMPGEQAMKEAGITPVKLTAKEGLALINGTPAMCSIGTLCTYDAVKLAKTADVIASISMQSEQGVIDPMDDRIHQLRKQPGQIKVAENMRRLMGGSKLTTHQGEVRVQDAYVFRCIPQIHGPSKDAIQYAYETMEREINAVTDNPLIFPETDQAISGGNFHGQYMAMGLDFLGIALSELADVSERRIERLVNPALSGLPAFLIKNGGLNSGMMIPQYTAAALVSENKVWAHPACVDSIPSSANQEDHVSMGMTAARKAKMILQNVENVLGIELMCAVHAVEFCGSAKLSPAGKAVFDLVREKVEPLQDDRVLYGDIEACAELVRSGAVLDAAEKMIGTLK